MSLQGTFDVIGLPDLLRMLASSRKSGELLIESGGAAGRLEFGEGSCIGAESTDVRGPVTDEQELHRRALDVCFSVQRNPGGSFRFTANDVARDAATRIVVEPLLGELELIAVEWEEICEVVPSTELRPSLAAHLPGDDIVISASEWSLLSRLDGYTSVSDLVDNAKESLVDICRSVAELVRRGAVELHEATTMGVRPDPTDDSETSGDVPYFGARIVPVEPYGPGVDDAEAPAADDTTVAAVASVAPVSPGVEAVADPAASADELGASDPADEFGDTPDAIQDAAAFAGTDPRDRGAILRLFSGLREA